MPNNRIFYAARKAGIAPQGSNSYTTLRGIQSLGMTTTFNLEQVFELGQLAIYENIEGIPDVQVEVDKVLDGYAPVYTLATQQAVGPTLVGRSAARCHLAVSIYPDTNNSATGAASAEAKMSGLFVSAVSYSVTVDANASEKVTLVGNDKVWVGLVANTSSASYTDDPFLNNNDSPISINGSGGVNRREDVLFVYPGGFGPGRDANGAVSGDGTVLPRAIYGISASGTNDTSSVTGAKGCHVKSFSASVNLGRENLFELGRRAPYNRYVKFPVEVTTEIGVTSVSGDLISVREDGITAGAGSCPVGSNLQNETIRLHMCEGLQLDLGKLNKLKTVAVTGGDTGGANEEVTYTYSNFNDFTVYHVRDPNRTTAAFDPKTNTVTAKF